jgi:energy-coupling factor transporter ATP-binding protein EcfA2
MKGKFIVFEGIDGSGKTTQASLLYSYLLSKGKKVVLTKEPTQGIIGSLIRAALSGEWKTNNATLQLLFSADRAHHIKTIKLTLSKREGQKVSYPKVILYLDKETYKPLKAEFFSSSGVKMKTVIYEEYGEFDGKVLLKKFRVKNEISGDETTIELSNYSTNTLPLSMFSKSALERIP